MDIQKLTKEQAIIISGFTGILCGEFYDFHADVEKRLGRGVQTFEFGIKSFITEVKKLYEADFIELATVDKEPAKAQAVQEGFVLVEKSKVRTWYQDDDEPENFCNSESDLDCLGDCLDDDDIIVVNIHESAHISTRKVFGVWKSNSPTDIQSKFVLVDSREEAEEIVASNKAMIEAQEPPQP